MQNLNIVYLSAALWLSLTSALAQYVDHPVPQYPEQWNSSWITHPGIDKTAHNLVHFRKSFQLEQVPEQFIIHISGDNRYRLYVETSANCKNYHHFRLIFPDNIYHKEIWEGFADYCLDHKIKFDISPDLCNAEITAGQLLIIKNDEDLAYAVRYCREHQLELGKDVGGHLL